MYRTTRYGADKFASARDEVVYRATLDGSDDEIGTVDDIGWHGLLLDFYGHDYIVRQDSRGFVDVESFDSTFVDHDGLTKRSAESGNRWVEIFDEYNQFVAELDSEDDES